MQQKNCIIHTQFTSYLISNPSKEGPYYIFLHGWGCTGSTFLPLLEKYTQDKHTVIAIDLPGFGGSPAPSHTRTIDQYSRFLDNFLKKVDIPPKKVVLIGHSFGGRIAIEYAAHTKVLGLVLIGSAGIPPRLSWKSKLFGILASCLRPLFKLCGANKIYEARAQQLRSQDYNNAGTLKHIFLQAIRYDQTPLLVSIHSPTLLLRGEKDTETPLTDAHIMYSNIPHAQLVTYPDAGHYVFLEETDKIYKDIQAFSHA